MDERAVILVVDDEPRGVELLIRALRPLGEVQGAQSGEEAWDLARGRPFDVVVSDQRMPGMTGVDLLGQIADSDELIGRVLLTGYADLNATVEAINRGRVHAYLSKPCPPEQLQTTVRSVLERVQLARENRVLIEQLRSKNRDLEEAMGRLQAARDLAEAAARAKSDFLANVSHEIRTPMTAILGFAEMITDEADTLERDRAIQAIQRNAGHLLRIINDILELSRTESGRIELRPEPVSIAELFDDLRDLMGPRARTRGLELELSLDPALPARIQTDPTRLRQILCNLLENAIRFTDRGRVALAGRACTRDAAACVEFAVSDTGIGMTREQQLQVFRPFTQVDASATRRAGGVGLGLTICRRLTETLGGTIAVASEPGGGSTFRVTLPAAPADEAKHPAEPAPQVRETDPLPELRGARVLLAEDSPDNQRLVRALLCKAGVAVEVAENGRVALDLARRARQDGEPFDVILMDMQMPELDGYDATRALRDEGYPGPIVALTAHAMDGHREECLAAGCDDYLTKPFDRTELLTVVARHRGKPPA